MKKFFIFSFSLIGQIGLSVAIPLVILGLIGRSLDRKFGTGPYLFLLGLTIATVIVYFILRNLIKKALAEFDKINKHTDNK